MVKKEAIPLSFILDLHSPHEAIKPVAAFMAREKLSYWPLVSTS